MRRIAFSAFAALTLTFIGTGIAHAQSTTITSPATFPEKSTRTRVFLGGSIDMGRADDWQTELVAALKDQNVEFLNPRRADWSPAWKPEASDPNFRAQVEWELAALEASDVIVMYLAPGSQSPISLLELGLHARSGKLIVLCPPGFWRKGNVDLTARRYGVEQVATMAELTAAVRRRVAAR